jgi:hypothetical protein
MSKKPQDRRRSPERVQRTRLGQTFNKLLGNQVSHPRLDERPIGLQEVYALIKDVPTITNVRMFSCDVVEARIVGGEFTSNTAPTTLYGISAHGDPDTGFAFVARNEFGSSDPLRLLDNGIAELSFDSWYSSGPISFRESILRSEQAKHLRNHVAVLVVGKVINLFYRVLSNVVQNGKSSMEPAWLHYSPHDKNPCLTHEDARVLIEELSSDHCIHKFEVFYSTGWKSIKEVVERCAFCQEERTRKPTNAEQDANTKSWKQLNKTHAVCHKVCKRLDGLGGYEAIEEAEKLAKKYKGRVQYVGCDDDAHASSALLLVDHENDKAYMGTSVIYLPQCRGTKATFFLYPNDRDALATALEIVRRKTATHRKEST